MEVSKEEEIDIIDDPVISCPLISHRDMAASNLLKTITLGGLSKCLLTILGTLYQIFPHILYSSNGL